MVDERDDEELAPGSDEDTQNDAPGADDESNDGEGLCEDEESGEGSTDDEDDGSSEDDEAKDKSGKDASKAKQANKRTIKARISSEVAKRRAAEREADYWRRRAEEGAPPRSDKPLTSQQGGATSDLKAPDPKEFEAVGGEFSNEYQRARDEYVAALAEERAVKRLQAARHEEAAAERRETLSTRASAVEAAGVAKYDDFDEVVEEGTLRAFRDDEVAIEALLDLENAHDVIYHLASNPDELDKVTAKRPAARAAHFGRLSARLSARHDAAGKKITKAQPVPGQARGAGGKFESSSDATYQKLLKELK